MSTNSAASCGATNRRGHPCRRRPAPGRRRCHYHGGAPGSGAQPGNANALKHGFYSSRIRDFAADLRAAAEQPLDLSAEIALLRVVLARALGNAPPQVLVSIVGTLARMVTVQYKLKAAQDDLQDAEARRTIQDVLEDVMNDPLGLGPDDPDSPVAPPGTSMGSFLEKTSPPYPPVDLDDENIGAGLPPSAPRGP
jgi:hypothetical protein